MTKTTLLPVRGPFAEFPRRSAAGRVPPDMHKKCSICGKEYAFHAWHRMDFVGIQYSALSPLELRNCSCGTTLGVFLDDSDDQESVL